MLLALFALFTLLTEVISQVSVVMYSGAGCRQSTEFIKYQLYPFVLSHPGLLSVQVTLFLRRQIDLRSFPSARGPATSADMAMSTVPANTAPENVT